MRSSLSSNSWLSFLPLAAVATVLAVASFSINTPSVLESSTDPRTAFGSKVVPGFPNPNHNLYDGLYHIRAVAKPKQEHKLSDNYIPDYVKSLPEVKRQSPKERHLERLSPGQQMLRLSKQTVKDMRHTTAAAVSLPGALGMVREDEQNVLGALSVAHPVKRKGHSSRLAKQRQLRQIQKHSHDLQIRAGGALDQVKETKQNIMGTLTAVPKSKANHPKSRNRKPTVSEWGRIHKSDREKARNPLNEYALRDLVRREREYARRSRAPDYEPSTLRTGPLSLRHILKHFEEYERDLSAWI